MKHVAAGFRRERMHEQAAVGWITWRHQGRDGLEVAARLLFVPELLAGGKFLQAERIVALGMADIAARMAGALLEEDRLDPRLEELVVERRRRLRRDGRSKRDINGRRHCCIDYQPPVHRLLSPYVPPHPE